MEIREVSIKDIHPYEKNPHYCDVIIDRWETYTGRKAEKVVS